MHLLFLPSWLAGQLLDEKEGEAAQNNLWKKGIYHVLHTNQADGKEISQLPRGPLNTLLRMALPPHLEYSAVKNFLTNGRGQLS